MSKRKQSKQIDVATAFARVINSSRHASKMTFDKYGRAMINAKLADKLRLKGKRGFIEIRVDVTNPRRIAIKSAASAVGNFSVDKRGYISGAGVRLGIEAAQPVFFFESDAKALDYVILEQIGE